MKDSPFPRASEWMDRRTVRLAQALDLLSSLDDVDPLRAAVIGTSFEDPERVWAASEPYRTLETRLLDLEVVEREVPRLLAEDTERRESVWRRVASALRALGAGDFAAAANFLVAAGEVEESAGRLEAAERLYQRALELGRKPRDRRGEGLALRRLGRVAKARADLPQAFRNYERGYEIAEAEGDLEGMIVASQGMGNCHVDEGRWEEAERWYRRGLELTREGPTRERWQIESNLSIVARRAGRMEESEEWLKSARATAAAARENEAMAYLDNAEGLLRVAQGRVDEAEAIYRSAVSAASSPAARATVLINLAECLLLQGRVAESVAVAREIERLAIANHLHPLLLYVYLALAAAARESGDAEALVFYEQALDLARAGGNLAEVAQVQREYAIWERGQGATESATERLRDAADLFQECGSIGEAEDTRRELELT